jgi:hypothetical protein
MFLFYYAGSPTLSSLLALWSRRAGGGNLKVA